MIDRCDCISIYPSDRDKQDKIRRSKITVLSCMKQNLFLVKDETGFPCCMFTTLMVVWRDLAVAVGSMEGEIKKKDDFT
jgi:hypothetical protein